MEIISYQHNPLTQPEALIENQIANRNGAPVASPLLRLHGILSETNALDEIVAFLPLRKNAFGRA